MKQTKSIIIFCLVASMLLVLGCAESVPREGVTQTTTTTSAKDTKGTAATQTTTTTSTTTTTAAPSTGSYSDLASSAAVTTETFKSKDELLAFIGENGGGSSYYGYSNYYRGGVMMEEGMAVKAVAAPSAAADYASSDSSSSSGGADYSVTNIQVQGVDEADILKTDGDYIYTVTDTVVFIIEAYPGEDAAVVSKIKLDEKPDSIFIEGDKLAVFGSMYDNTYFAKINFRPTYGMTYLNIYDISDKSNPTLEKEYKFEGSYFRGRMADGYMYILTTTRPEYRIDPLPVIYEGTVKSTIAVDHIYYYPIPYNDPLFINIHSIDMTDGSLVDSAAVTVEGSQNLYMSSDNIFVAYTEYINEWEVQQQVTMDVLEPKLTSSDTALIDKIKKVDSEILSKSEKQQKIYQIYERVLYSLSEDDRDEVDTSVDEKLKEELDKYDYFEYTIINRIGVDKGIITPAANGKVPGTTMNQFSMDESNHVLRIATTVSAHWSSYGKQSSQSTNNVYTLDRNLDVMDKIEGLAEGEQIYSTRFIDERLYMVTYRQVDPFFVIDLSNPEKIKELGKLKIPGFSKYLHPYDKDVVIGIGQDATAMGRVKGLKISLFDVSDVSDPQEIAKYTTDEKYASSTALYEHKAFLFDKEKALLVIPVYNYNYEDKSENYNGAFVFNITKSSITLRGLIDHSQGKTEAYWQPSVERSLFIEELLYTKSPYLLRINKLEDLSKVKNVELNYTSSKIPVY